MSLTAKGMSSRMWRLAAVGATAVFTVGIVASPAVALDGTGTAPNPGGRVALVNGAGPDVCAMVGGPMAVDA